MSLSLKFLKIVKKNIKSLQKKKAEKSKVDLTIQFLSLRILSIMALWIQSVMPIWHYEIGQWSVDLFVVTG